MLPGQITFWDIEMTEKHKKVTEKPVSFIKTEQKVTEIGNSYTEKQGKVIDKYKGFNNLERIIHYCGGGIGIELFNEEGYKTIYINKQGKEEFTSGKKLPVLLMDRIIYYKFFQSVINNMQEEKLKEVLKENPEGIVIRRKADDRIQVQLPDKVISINPIGWTLEYQGCRAVYENDEVDRQDRTVEANIEDIQKAIKLGDFIEAQHGQRLIQGEIVHIYGSGNETLNISFDNNTRETAIHRSRVTRLIKCA
jgi:hypothetical protein